MSTTTLDPLVAGKLRQFSRRRFWMILLRGICAAVVTFLLCMAVVAFLDWGWVLGENTRWGLSAVAYGLTAAVTWIVSGRRLIHKPAQEEVASQVETAEPELREQLLSAVELATDSPDSVHDSPIFRGLLGASCETDGKNPSRQHPAGTANDEVADCGSRCHWRDRICVDGRRPSFQKSGCSRSDADGQYRSRVAH